MVSPLIVPPQASVAVGSSAASSVTEQARVIVGSDATFGVGGGEFASRSQPTWFTVTLKEHSAALPDGSVAVHWTWVVPTGKLLPEAGVQSTETEPLSSEAVTP